DKVEALDEFIALESMLAAETIRVGALLDFFAREGSGDDAAAGDYFALVNARTDAGGEPRIDLAELHIGFGERDAFDGAHGGVSFEEKVELGLERNLEGIFFKGRLPTGDVGALVGHDYVLAFSERGGLGDRDRLRSAGGNAFAREFVRGG